MIKSTLNPKNTFIVKIFSIILLAFCFYSFSFAQNASPQFINYQAVARNASGKVMQNKALEVRISFTTRDGVSAVYYQEIHQIQTNEQGVFSLFVGGGTPQVASFQTIPWAKKNIYLGIEFASEENPRYKLVSRSQMLSVPYAFVTEQAGTLADTAKVKLRNQSIYWVTSGNEETRPQVHYIGTRDDRPLVIKTNGVERAVVSNSGQWCITSVVDGAEDDPNAYPLRVEGGDQGIYIKVNGARDGGNNFMTFADNSQVWGRIEGQTWSEITSSEPYIIQTALYALQGLSYALQIGGEIAAASGYTASILATGAAPPTVSNSIILASEIAILIADGITWADDLQQNQGVAFASGNGDYAEYILRVPQSRDLQVGEVVGIKGGQVSLNTESADHLRIISGAPAVLGNAPQPSEEDKYEKVAFLGQVRVRVTGAVSIGDYILPSGNNDGLAIAVAPDNMKIGDYKRIIGVAWEEANFAMLNIVNIAIGINTNDLGYELDILNKKVYRIYDYLEGKGDLAEMDSPALKTLAKTAKTSKLQKQISDEDFDKILDNNKVLLEAAFQEAKVILTKQGYDLAKLPQLEAFMDKPIPEMKKLRRDPKYFSQMAQLDQNWTNKAASGQGQ